MTPKEQTSRSASLSKKGTIDVAQQNHETNRSSGSGNVRVVDPPPTAAMVVSFCSFSHDQVKSLASAVRDEDREKVAIPLHKYVVSKSKQLTDLEPMKWWEEAICVIVLALGVPNGAITIPAITFLIGRFLVGNITLAFQILLMILLPLALLPQPFVPSTLTSWIAVQMVKYFSFRFIYVDRPPVQPKDTADPNRSVRPQILVAPPHGVFPYGNLLAMLVWPTLTGHHFLGLAANAAVRTPVFRQILCAMGVVDASRQTARRALERYPYTVGISTGGVAEVFETNSHDECIVLKERIGLIKLAIRTGADLVPCYIFGNTKSLSCWAGEGIPGARKVLEWISRRVVGFAVVGVVGRWGLPIPRRVPTLGVSGRAVPTHHLQCEEPTPEQVAMIQNQLVVEMQAVFDRYKGVYGWEDKQLIIK